jgi:hypothetical protein
MNILKNNFIDKIISVLFEGLMIFNSSIESQKCGMCVCSNCDLLSAQRVASVLNQERDMDQIEKNYQFFMQQ